MGKYEYTDIERKTLERSRAPFAIYQFVDRKVVTLILTDGFCELFGYSDRAKAYYDMDNDMYVDTHPDDKAAAAEEALRFATEGGRYETIYRSRIPGSKEYRIIHAQGEHFYTETGERLAIVWYTDEGKYNTGDTSRETELNQYLSEVMHEQSLIRASNYDYLTGLPSMTYFFDLAEEIRRSMLASGGRPAMLFADLSGMKFYNRKYGYSKGDELLVAFAGMLAKYFGHDNCCRMGEDHFTVVTDEEGLDEKLDSLFSEWDGLHRNDALAIRIGVYRNSMEVVDASSACDRAKYACDSLRDSFVSGVSYFNEDMLYEARGKQYIIENIDRAIEEKWIVPYYQAIVRSLNGKVCDEEALARWMDPERGMMSPGLFVPVLEDAGLIYKLDLYMIERALEKIKTMRAMGLETNPISINLSRRDFETCDIIEEIIKRVDEAGLEYSDLNIEITESTIARDVDYMKAQVERFRERGFQVWMDDFGSGYSSLDVLQTIRFDLIKFDMHFMQQFDSGDEAKIILTELMKMANALGVDTICEGVEKEEQVQFLREIGCSKIQGFYYERPLSFEDLMRKFGKGQQIGFEEPGEKEYYEELGRINLYDLSMIAGRDSGDLKHYFDTLPMSIIEIRGREARFARSNRSYREFVNNACGFEIPRNVTRFSTRPEGIGYWFLERVRECSRTGGSTIVDEKLPDGTTCHTFLRNIARNPVDGTSAVATVVLAITDDRDELKYVNIARALAADYFNIFYVDLRTDEFTEYTSDAGRESMVVERHASGFFENAETNIVEYVVEEDRERFMRLFTKENILNALDRQKSFMLEYRMPLKGRSVYVSLKAMRMPDDNEHIIVAISNINLQMNQRRAIERLTQEQTMYNRLKALTGDFMVMYTIDPVTGSYIESSVNSEYEGLGVAKAGRNFFEDKDINAEKLIHPEDRVRFKLLLERDILLKKLEKDNLLTMTYRMIIDGKDVPVRLRAAMVKEPEGDKLIIAVNHLNENEE